MAEARPRGARALVKVLENKQRPSGIEIPPGVMTWPDRGMVVSVGPGYRKPDGDYLPLDLDVGDEVLFYARNGVEVMLNGETLVLMGDEHIMLVSDPVREPERSDVS